MPKTRHLVTLFNAHPADVALRQKVLEITKVLEQFNRDNVDAFGAYISGFHFMSFEELVAFRNATMDAHHHAAIEIEQRVKQDRKERRARARARARQARAKR